MMLAVRFAIRVTMIIAIIVVFVKAYREVEEEAKSKRNPVVRKKEAEKNEVRNENDTMYAIPLENETIYTDVHGLNDAIARMFEETNEISDKKAKAKEQRVE